MITLHQLSLHFSAGHLEKKTIFHRFSFRFPPQGLVVVTGDSGIGKSSLLKVIAGQIKPTQGKVRFHQRKPIHPPIYLSDQARLIANWPVKRYLGNPFEKENLLSVGLAAQVLTQTYGQLSGGQQVRMALQVYLSQPAVAYLLDEPTHALDLENRRLIVDNLVRFARNHLLIVASHDPLLISAANQTIAMHSPYQITSTLHHCALPDSHTAHPIAPSRTLTKWVHHLIYLAKPKRLGRMLNVGVFLLAIILDGMLTITLRFQSQVDAYHRLQQTHPWFHLQKTISQPIRDSPFQLVKTAYPDDESLQTSLLQLPKVKWLDDLGFWFPSVIDVHGISYQLRFVDLPFVDAAISVAWIHHGEAPPTKLTIQSLPMDDLGQTYTFTATTIPLSIRKVTTWFEPPQLHLSYWQWVWLLQGHYLYKEDEAISFYQALRTMYPPPHALIYDPDQQLKPIFASSSSDTTFTYSSTLSSLYPLIEPFLLPFMAIIPWLIAGVWLLFCLMTWTQFHWYDQQHRYDWQWLIAIHVPFRTIWQKLTLRLMRKWIFTLSIGLSLMTFGFWQQPWLSMPSMLGLMMSQTILLLFLLGSQHMIRSWYRHA